MNANLHLTRTRWRLLATVSIGCLLAMLSNLAAGTEPIRTISASIDVDPKKVALGRMLFSEVRLSKDNTISCNSCHDLEQGGADGRRVSIGVDGKEGLVNSPTVYNSAGSIKQFWDGRADDLASQVDGPVQTKHEFGSLWPDVVTKLYEDAKYPALFDAIYPDGITRKSIKDAIAEFERVLITPNSRFDKWLNGDADAITPQEKRGYDMFKQYGCSSCHQGANVGGNMFQVFGVIDSYFEARGNITKADLGRYNVTGNDADRHAFKVPSLRLVALTPPYLHDGRAPTLRAAVDIMFRHQLGREAPDQDKDDIVTFLKTLAGELLGYKP
jgi:cytochrome c peroxidase